MYLRFSFSHPCPIHGKRDCQVPQPIRLLLIILQQIRNSPPKAPSILKRTNALKSGGFLPSALEWKDTTHKLITRVVLETAKKSSFSKELQISTDSSNLDRLTQQEFNLVQFRKLKSDIGRRTMPNPHGCLGGSKGQVPRSKNFDILEIPHARCCRIIGFCVHEGICLCDCPARGPRTLIIMLQIQCCVNKTEFENGYHEMLEAHDTPLVFKHSPHSSLPITITGSLLRVKALVQQQPQIADVLLKAASLEIIRFVSMLADMYTSKSFKDKNKSVASVLSQKHLHLEYSDILSEMRHALTHKAIPDRVLILSSIDYILEYLDDHFWKPKMAQKRPQADYRAKLKLKLDALTSEEYEFEELKYDQLEGSIIYCLDYLMGLADFHVVTKQSIKQRLTDRKVGEQRLSVVGKYVINFIRMQINNKLIKKQKLQLLRRKKILQSPNFVRLYQKLAVIGQIKPKIASFIESLEAELPEITESRAQMNKRQEGIYKKQLIGQLYHQFSESL